jgi:hypothetical protein
MRSIAAGLLALVLVGVPTACSSDGGKPAPKPSTTTSTTVDARNSTYRVKLRAVADGQAPGDPDGTGSGVVRLVGDQPQKQLCATLKLTKIGQIVAVHLQQGTLPKPGLIVSPLAVSGDGKVDGCRPVSDEVYNEIRANPAGHLVNVRTREFPTGALRGLLEGEPSTNVPTTPPTTPASTPPTLPPSTTTTLAKKG